jgi:hypothetical protein
VASWLFFRVARPLRIDLDALDALKNSQLTFGGRHAYFGDRTPGRRKVFQVDWHP